MQLIGVATKHQLSGDALLACERAEAAGLVVEDSDSPIRGSVVVDALLGTGMRGAPRSSYAEAIEAINAVDGYVLSIDLPLA